MKPDDESTRDVDAERWAEMRSVMEQCDAVRQVHVRLMRGESLTNLDRMMVGRLIRLLVAEWV